MHPTEFIVVLSAHFTRLLNGNKLTGPLPEELGYLPNLDRIQIDQNQISGSIPKSFANLNKTKHLWVNTSIYCPKPADFLSLFFLAYMFSCSSFLRWAVIWTTIQLVAKSHMSCQDYQVLFTCKFAVVVFLNGSRSFKYFIVLEFIYLILFKS